MMRKHIETVVVALLASGLMGLVNFYVQAQSTSAVVVRQLAEHERRLGALEEAAQAVAVTQQHVASTQTMLAEMLQRLETRHDVDVRELRGHR